MRVGGKPGWSLTRRLVCLLMLILLVIATLQIGFVYRALLKEADEVFDAQLKQAAQALVLTAPTQSTALVSPEAGKAEELDLLIRERGSSGELLVPSVLVAVPHRAVFLAPGLSCDGPGADPGGQLHFLR